MNIYPIFDLPIKYYDRATKDNYSYSLFTKHEIARGMHSMRDLALYGDILIGNSRKRFWTRVPGSWAEHEFSDLPEEYKAWIVLLG